MTTKTSKKVNLPEGILVAINPAPYVINGPKNQNSFHEKLIGMQKLSPYSNIDWNLYKLRLSLVKDVENEPTAQYLLESPREAAKTWSSNYGPHGWHRYVGRFPPHLVRSLLNYFNASSEDIVCDPFAGSGTTLVESRLLGIPSVGIEICPLSCLISRTKSTFPDKTDELFVAIKNFEQFYIREHKDFLAKTKNNFGHEDILQRKGNNIKSFVNIGRWFTSEALLGVSLVTEFAATQSGYNQDFILTALSSKMRSIGNVDVNVIRAEYSKKAREKVDVFKIVKSQLLKMVHDIEMTIESHKKIMASKPKISIEQKSLLESDIKSNSISYIITSPPYGVESLSYLRTHLLSYRTLGYFLKTDPYEFGAKVIGSEYLPKDEPNILNLSVLKVSKTFREFFEKIYKKEEIKTHKIRVGMMMHFFQDMEGVADKFKKWVKPNGKIAFVVGNKRIGDDVVPTDTIIAEIFKNKGFVLEEVLGHKLKTNNSNSVVPWQSRIIDQEFIMIFQKKV